MPKPIETTAPRIAEAGGVLRVGGTGVTLETVVWAYQQGSTPEDIADQFPSLDLADVYEALGYYLRHREAIDRYLSTREKQYRQITERLNRRIPKSPIRTKLRIRRR